MVCLPGNGGSMSLEGRIIKKINLVIDKKDLDVAEHIKEMVGRWGYEVRVFSDIPSTEEMIKYYEESGEEIPDINLVDYRWELTAETFGERTAFDFLKEHSKLNLFYYFIFNSRGPLIGDLIVHGAPYYRQKKNRGDGKKLSDLFTLDEIMCDVYGVIMNYEIHRKKIVLLTDNSEDIEYYSSIIESPPSSIVINDTERFKEVKFNTDCFPYVVHGFSDPKLAMDFVMTNNTFAVMVQYNFGEKEVLKPGEKTFWERCRDLYLPTYEGERALSRAVNFSKEVNRESSHTKVIIIGIPEEKRSFTAYLLQEAKIDWNLTESDTKGSGACKLLYSIFNVMGRDEK